MADSCLGHSAALGARPVHEPQQERPADPALVSPCPRSPRRVLKVGGEGPSLSDKRANRLSPQQLPCKALGRGCVQGPLPSLAGRIPARPHLSHCNTLLKRGRDL